MSESDKKFESRLITEHSPKLFCSRQKNNDGLPVTARCDQLKHSYRDESALQCQICCFMSNSFTKEGDSIFPRISESKVPPCYITLQFHV